MAGFKRRHTWSTESLLDLILISISAAIAVFFLFHRIGAVPPPYPWTDESAIAADAVETLTNGPELVYPDQLAGGSLAVYLEAAFMALFGRSLLGLRVLSALVGVSLVVGIYALSRVMLASQGKLFSQIVAGLTSLWLASSVWLLALGRIAVLHFALMPPMTVVCFYLLWRGLETGRQRYFVLSGLMLGLSLHGYVPAVFLPVALAAFFITEWFVSKLDQRSSLLRVYWSQLVALLVAATVVALPLLIYFAANPEIILRRPMQVAQVGQSLAGNRLFHSLFDTLSSFGFFPWQLFQRQREASIFHPLTALLFLIGIGSALARLKRPAQLFLLIWWVTLILPAVLSSASVGFDLMRRAGGAEPVTFVFPSLGLVTIGQWLWARRPGLVSTIATPVAAVLLVLPGISSYRFYFVDWANRPDIPRLFAEGPTRFAEWVVAEATPDTAYVLPIRPDVSPTTRPELFTLRYLYEGQAAIDYPVFDEVTLPVALTDLSTGKSVIKLMLPNRVDIDPKGYLNFLLEQHGVQTDQQTRFGYTIKTYQLASDSEEFSNPSLFIPANIEFGQAIRLADYAASDIILPAGETIWLTIHWTKVADKDRDYSISLSLVDSKGYAFATVDKPLLNDVQHETTSHWAIGETAADYYTMPVPAHTPPGDYTLEVVVYNAAGERLVPARGKIDLTSPLAEITVVPATLPIEPESLAIGTPVEIPVTSDLRVIGMDLSHASIARPGDQVLVTVIWQAIGAPQLSYDLAMGLIGKEGLAYATSPQPLISASYPTNQWRPGEILKTHYTLSLPPGLESGNYNLAMRLLDSETGSIASEQILQPLMVEARFHSFAIPNPSRLLNVDFGTTVRLVGYDQPFVSEGNHLTVQLYWQALAEMSESYKVFAHLIDPNGTIVAQSDFVPGGGVAPTTSWVSGEIITDTIQVSLPETAPNSMFQLVIGLYNSVSGVRLPVSPGVGNADSLVLPENISGK
jgi:4-amino-4-deoxy-L-arabinose transferase-like glycosyltransferase